MEIPEISNPPQMIQGARIVNYNVNGLFRTKGLLTIEMVFPQWKRGIGIFEYLKGFEFNDTDETAIELNVDYIGNYSSTKVASRIIHNLWDEENDLLAEPQVRVLAGIIRRRYGMKWTAIWEQYAIQPWFDNVLLVDKMTHGKVETQTHQGNIVDRKIGSDTDTFTPYGKKLVSEGGTSGDNVTHIGGYDDNVSYIGSENRDLIYAGHTDTDNLANTGNDDTQHTGTEQHETQYSGSTKDSGSSSYDDNVFGFNSTSENGIPSAKGSGTDGNTRTFEDRKDTVKITYPVVRSDKILYSSNNDRTLTYEEHTDKNNLSYSQDRADNREFTYKEGTSDNHSITHGKTLTTQYLDEYKEENKTLYGSANLREWKDYEGKKSNSGTDSRGVTGMDYRRYSKIQELISMFDNQNLFPFFEMLFDDLDKVLTVPIFK